MSVATGTAAVRAKAAQLAAAEQAAFTQKLVDVATSASRTNEQDTASTIGAKATHARTVLQTDYVLSQLKAMSQASTLPSSSAASLLSGGTTTVESLSKLQESLRSLVSNESGNTGASSGVAGSANLTLVAASAEYASAG